MSQEMEAPKEKLPINVTFEIEQHEAPNDHWFEVTPVLSWEEAAYIQRMETCLVVRNELEEIKEAQRFLIERTFAIQNVNEQIINPFEDGKRQMGESLEKWQEMEWSSRQAYVQHARVKMQEEMEGAQAKAQRKDNTLEQLHFLHRHIRYCRGRLARLAEEEE